MSFDVQDLLNHIWVKFTSDMSSWSCYADGNSFFIL